jgi:hypothetical protein
MRAFFKLDDNNSFGEHFGSKEAQIILVVFCYLATKLFERVRERTESEQITFLAASRNQDRNEGYKLWVHLTEE